MSDWQLVDKCINDYATYADKRDAQAQRNLFTQDGKMVVYYPWGDADKPDIVQGDAALLQTFENLKQYQHTLHVIGQKTITLNQDSATAYVYTVAHHVTLNDDGSRTLMVAYLRYEDTLIKQDGVWLFSERVLYADFIENRPLN